MGLAAAWSRYLKVVVIYLVPQSRPTSAPNAGTAYMNKPSILALAETPFHLRRVEVKQFRPVLRIDQLSIHRDNFNWWA
jgi:hypothetical protein